MLGLYFQELLGLSALDAGLMFLPMSGVVAGVNVASARAATRYGPRVPIVTGQVICALGLLGLLAAAGTGTGVARPLLALLLVPLGAGLGFAVPSVTAAMLTGVAPERAGLAGGVFNSVRQVGSALAVAVFGALVVHHATFLAGLRVSLLTCAVLLAMTAVAGLALPATARRAG